MEIDSKGARNLESARPIDSKTKEQLLRRMRIAAVLVSAMLATLAVSATPAGAVPTDSVTVVSPNGAAKVRGTIYWYGKRHWEFRGWLSDIACNSHDVYLTMFKNRRFSWDHYEGTWLFWPGTSIVGNWRNSGGCNVSKLVFIEYTDGVHDTHDVGFSACDDGFKDSCNHYKWPEEWYGVYHNPYTSW